LEKGNTVSNSPMPSSREAKDAGFPPETHPFFSAFHIHFWLRKKHHSTKAKHHTRRKTKRPEIYLDVQLEVFERLGSVGYNPNILHL